MRMPVGLSLVQKTVIDHIQKHGTPKSQAYLAREIGRTRASVHSAVKVLRRRAYCVKTVYRSHHYSSIRKHGLINASSIMNGMMKGIHVEIRTNSFQVCAIYMCRWPKIPACSESAYLRFRFPWLVEIEKA